MRREIPVKHEIPVDPGSSETTDCEGGKTREKEKERKERRRREYGSR